MTGSKDLELDLLAAEDRRVAARILGCEFHDGCDVLAATRRGILLGTIQIELQAGWTASVELPRLASNVGSDGDGVLAVLWSGVEHYSRRRGVVWMQTLVGDDDPSQSAMLVAQGFERLGELSYQVCLARRFPTTPLDPRLSFRPAAESPPRLLEETLAVTYIGSRDFPEMEGRRSIEDLLDGYRAVGVAREANWWLAWRDDVPIGCVLLAEHRSSPADEQNGRDPPFTELIYWGVVPVQRGQGYGAELLAWALYQSRLLGADKLILAFDIRNLPAQRVYERFGLIEWARKTAWVKPLATRI